MLPSQTYARLLQDGEILGLRLTDGGAEKRTFLFKIITIEGPNDLTGYSMGAASAQNTAGTDWDEIVTSDGRYQLEPENERAIYHCFYGITPGQARIYTRYPSEKDLNSLLGTRSFGGSVGFIDGAKSPYLYPSPITEFFTMKGMHPSFNGYHPYLEPTSITIKLNFYVTRYDVEVIGVVPLGGQDADSKWLIAPGHAVARAKVRTVGGRGLVPIPSWLENKVRFSTPQASSVRR